MYENKRAAPNGSGTRTTKEGPDSVSGHFGGAISAAFGAKTGAAFDFARLLVVFAATHLFFDPAPFDELAETANGILNGFFFTQG